MSMLVDVQAANREKDGQASGDGVVHSNPFPSNLPLWRDALPSFSFSSDSSPLPSPSPQCYVDRSSPAFESEVTMAQQGWSHTQSHRTQSQNIGATGATQKEKIEGLAEMKHIGGNLLKQSTKEGFPDNLSYTPQSSSKKYEDNVSKYDPLTAQHSKSTSNDGFRFCGTSSGIAFNLQIPSTGILKDDAEESEDGSRQQRLFSTSASSDAPVASSKPYSRPLGSLYSTVVGNHDITEDTHFLCSDRKTGLCFDITEDTHFLCSDRNTGLCFAVDPYHTSNESPSLGDPEKKTEVFMFGASRENENKAVPIKEKATKFSTQRPSLRSGISRAKKNSDAAKGKGLSTSNSRATGGTPIESAEHSFFTRFYPASASSAASCDNINDSVSSFEQSQDFSSRDNKIMNSGKKHGCTVDPNFCFSVASHPSTSKIEEFDVLAAIDTQLNQWHPFLSSFEGVNSKVGAQAQDAGPCESTNPSDFFQGHSEDHMAGDMRKGEKQIMDDKFGSGVCKDSNQILQSSCSEGNSPRDADKLVQECLKEVKQDKTSTMLYSKFSKTDGFEGNLDKLEKNQEAICNDFFIKETKKPFIFQASKLKSNLVSNTADVQSSTTFDPSIPAKDTRGVTSGFISQNGMFEKDHPNNLCMSKSNDSYFVDASADCSRTVPAYSPFKLGVNIGSNIFDGRNVSSNLGSVPQPFFSSSTFKNISFMNPNDNMEPVRNSQASAEHDGVPVGEFSCQPSSSDSSDSESRSRKHEHSQGADVFHSSLYSFEFQSSNGVKYSSKTRRMKEKVQRLSLKHRKQNRHSKHNKGNVKPSYEGLPVLDRSPEGGGSPMDFSPCFEPEHFAATPLHSDASIPNCKQYSAFQKSAIESKNVAVNDPDRVNAIGEDLLDEELRDLDIGKEKDAHFFHTSYEGSNRQEFWWSSTDASTSETGMQRNEAFLDEHSKFAGFEGFTSVYEKDGCRSNKDFVDDFLQDDSRSNSRKHLRFMAGFLENPSFRKHTGRIQDERVDVLGFKKNLVTSSFGNDQETSIIEESRNLPHMIATAANIEENNGRKTLSQENAYYIPGQTEQTDKSFPKFSCDASTKNPSIQEQQSEGGMATTSRTIKSVAAEQLCEHWRLRGNQAYADGDFPKAEECYSRGASSVSSNETSESCIRASMLCYSNRAATRMAVGRIREALADCMRAMEVDPRFLRVRLRAASCHLALGESQAAATLFNEILRLSIETDKLDAKVSAEVSEGLKKVQQLGEYSDQAVTFLQSESTSDATAALRLLNEALTISPYDEHLLELKTEALLSLRRYEEVIELCEESLASAERNHLSVIRELSVRASNSSCNETCTGNGNISVKLWRWRIRAKALFHLGKLEESLDLVKKYDEGLKLSCDKCRDMENSRVESLAAFAANIHALLRHKAAGNEAFQAGKHVEAIEHYSAALAYSGESRPFSAVCFCNRAAASQALGNVLDAIADCSRAIVLDPSYPKAISRRATLYEMVRNYTQACHDLRRLINLYESYHQERDDSILERQGSAGSKVVELKHAHVRLAKSEEEMKKGHPLDHYLILGVEPSCSASEIKKAYRKAALRHHPDKASQFLVCGESADEGNLWKEIGDDVRSDAEHLFKMIGESYAILSDPAKRLRYDTDEELRKLRTDSSVDITSGRSEPYRSQYEKNNRRQRERWDSWNGYAQQHQRWQSGPDAAQPDTYGRKGSYMANAFKSGRDSWEQA